jgi:hypothetical protein
MKCNLLEPRWPDYVTGHLSREERVSLEAHLARCPACRREVAELKRVIGAVRSDTAPPPTSAEWARFEAGLRARLESSRGIRSRWRAAFPRVALPLAAVAATVLLLVRLLSPSPPGSGGEPLLPAGLDSGQVLALAGEIETMLPLETEDPGMALDLAALDDSWLPEESTIEAVVSLVEELYDPLELADEEHWTQEEAAAFIQLYAETV